MDLWKKIAASILLMLLVWALFRQTGDFEFLRLDDHDYTYRCAFVKDGLSLANVREAFTNARHGGIWMPVTYISYMCDISLFGPGPGAHHLVNVAIHALNAVLLLWLLVSLAAKNAKVAKIILFLLAAFWALHPQRAEAVAWIASRKELLCTAFILGGLLCWRRSIIGTYACYILACMSKPTAMCFPFLVLAVDWIRHSTADARQSATGNNNFTLYALHFPLFICIAAAIGSLAIYSQTHPEGHAELALYSAPLWWRLLNAAVAVGLYLFQMVIPVGVHLDYRAVPGGWPVHGALGLGVLAVVVGAGAWWICRRIRRRHGQDLVADCHLLFFIGASCLWFFAALAPTLGIFGSFGEHARADRFLYLPAMAVPIAAMLLYGAQAMPTGRKGILPVAGLAIVVAGFSAVAYPVVASYRNDVTAFMRSAECDPGHGRALAHLGEARCAAGDLDAGIELLRKSREVRPRDATDAKLAYALMRRGRADDWKEIREVCAAIVKDPARDVRGQALEALGTAELVARNWDEATRHLVLSVKAPARHYSSADAILKLAYAHHNGGRRDEAQKLFEWVVSKSGREDLAVRARQVLAIIEASPQSILFW